MSNAEKMLIVSSADIEKARSEAEAGVNCCGCSGSGEAMDLLAKILAESTALETVGYITPSGFYPTKLEAVANGEQSVEPVYRVKK